MATKAISKLAKWAATVEGVTLFTKKEAPTITAVSTGNAVIDLVTGIGGFPAGRMVEVFGTESSGKTTLALQCAAKVQRNGGGVLFIDAEHAFDPNYFASLGGDLKELVLYQPQSAEDAFKLARDACGSGAVSLVIIDSIASMTPAAELEPEDKSGLGLQARLMSVELRRMVAPANNNGVLVLLINQVRTKPNSYGNPEYTPGGNALKFYTSMRISLKNIGQIKRSDKVIGNTIRIRAVKNKLAQPYKEVEVPLYYGLGFSQTAALLDYATNELNLKAVSKSRGVWKINDKSYTDHHEALRAFEASPELAHEVLEAIRAVDVLETAQ